MGTKIDSGRSAASPPTLALEPASHRKSGTAPARTRRTRRSAPEAKRQILDAAESQLVQLGPAGLRLQSIAAEIGLSHPVILHHFGSREGLIDALNARTVDQLKSSMASLLADATAPNRNLVETTLEHVFNAFGNGLAQRLAWLATAGSAGENPMHEALSEIAQLVQRARTAYAREQDAPPPPFEDSRRIALLVATSAMGAAIFGTAMINGPKEVGFSERVVPFRTWLSELILMYLDQFPSGMAPQADRAEHRHHRKPDAE